jgi:hypothetical protein
MFSLQDIKEHPTQTYLAIVFAISLFRVSMYMIDINRPAKVKISPEAWGDFRVREVTIAWMKTILSFMQYRTMVVGVLLYFSSSPESVTTREQFFFCLANFLIDIKLLRGMITRFGRVAKGNAISHRNNLPPLILQSMLFLAGIVYVVFMYVYHPHFFTWQI